MPGDIILLQMCTLNENHDVWFLRYGAQQIFFVILGHFLPCYCISNLKNWTFEKMKKKLGDIIILHLCTTNYDHTMYSSWDTEHDRQNFLMLWPFFALLPQENQNFETMKEVSQNIIISNMCTKNYDQMMSGNWDMVHDEQTDRQTDRWTNRCMEKVT